MARKARWTLLCWLVALMALTGCAQPATEAPQDIPSAAPAPPPTETAPPEVASPAPPEEVEPTPTTVPPTPIETAQPTPAQAASPAPTTAPPPPPATQNWAEFCQPAPQEEGVLVANLAMGTTVELEAYLYVKSFSMLREGMMPFTLREIPYQSGSTDWNDVCQVHLLIPIGSGPNHVNELPDNFQMGDVVVWDATGREIRGWQRNLDSYRVRVRGLMVEAYGADTGLDGSNTIRLETIELL